MKLITESDRVSRVDSGSKYEKLVNFSRAVRVDDWIFVSNTSGYDYANNRIGESAHEQAEQMFVNIETALKTAGGQMSDIVVAKLFAPNASDLDEIVPLLAARFADARPAMTTTCTPLASDYLKVEMEVMAYVRK